MDGGLRSGRAVPALLFKPVYLRERRDGLENGFGKRGRGPGQGLDGGPGGGRREGGNNGGRIGGLGRDAGLSARPDAESAADVAARRPAGAGRFGDLDGLGEMNSMQRIESR